MLSKRRKRSSPWRILMLVGLIGTVLYFNQVVVPATPSFLSPTPTATRSPESFKNEAEAFFSEGKLPQAIAAFKQTIQADPENPANYIALARVQVFAGEYEEAKLNAENATLLSPTNSMAHAVKGWALDFLQDYPNALQAVQRAIELDPNNALAHAYLAEILIDNGDFGDLGKASEASQKALELGPVMMESHRARGYVLFNTQNYPQAVQEYLAAIAINDNLADLHLLLGVAYKALPDYDEAEEELLIAIKLNPSDPISIIELSLTYAVQGQFGKAVQYAEQAIKINPGNARLHGHLGIMYYKNNQFSLAADHLALTIHGGVSEDGAPVEGMPLDYGRVAEYYWFYGFALAKMTPNRCTEAIPIFQALLNGVPDYDIAVDNANFGLDLCLENVSEATPEVEATPTAEP